MAWEDATYIVNKIKGTIVPMLNSLQTNVINGVNDTMNNVIDNVLVPKLPDNRDPLTFSTVQVRTTKRLFSVPPYKHTSSTGPNGESWGYYYSDFIQTSSPYTTPVMGYYRYRIQQISPSSYGELINGKGKIVVSGTWMIFAQIDGGPIYSINAEEKVLNTAHWYDTSYGELTFSKSIRVYTQARAFWDEQMDTTTSFVGQSDTFNFTNSSATERANYEVQAYNRCISALKSGDTHLGKNYLLYLA